MRVQGVPGVVCFYSSRRHPDSWKTKFSTQAFTCAASKHMIYCCIGLAPSQIAVEVKVTVACDGFRSLAAFVLYWSLRRNHVTDPGIDTHSVDRV